MKKTNRFLYNCMNRFLKAAALFLAGSLLFSGLVSCALDEGEESGKNTNIEAEEKNGSKIDKMAYLVLSASTTSRALYPEADENDLTNLTLSYKKPTATSWGKICDFESYDELTANSSLALTPDTYNFKLTGKIDSSEFAGEITVELKSGKNELNFPLKQTSKGSGKGSVTYTVTFPNTDAAGIKAVKVSGIGLDVKALVPSGSVSENDSKKDNSTWITSNLVVKKGSFTYTASNVPAGSYKVYVSFYADTEYNSEITKYPETVNISSGLTTSGTYTVTQDNLNQIYSINYVLGDDGDFVSGYTVPEKYTRMDKGSLALPAASDVQNHARMLIGWSTENDAANSNIITDPAEIAEVQVISSVDTSELKDITLYAKWFNGYVIDTAKNAEVLDSLNLSTAIGKYQLMVKGAATSSTLTALNTIINTAPAVPASGTATCEVMLSLTDTTGLTTIETQFKGNAKLAGLTIPASVTSIGDKAFDDCTALKTLRFEDGTETLSLGCNYYTSSISNSEGLFYDCPLTSLYLGRNLSYKNYPNSSYTYSSYPEYYGYSAFAKIQSTKNASDREDFSVEIGKDVTSIPKYLFYNCYSLKSVTISSEANITSIGISAFKKGQRLSSFDIPSTVKTINDEAFSDCIALSSITIPTATTAIGDKVFDNCTGLKTVVFEDGTETIYLGCNYYTSSISNSEGLFYDCPLTSLYLGRNLSYKKFSDSSSTYGSAPEYYGYSAFAKIQNNVSTKEDFSVEIGKDVTSIPKYLLYNCLSLKSVTISSEAQITSIGISAFKKGQRLSSFDIPSTVKTINDEAFSDCIALSSITIPAATTAIGDRVFDNCTGLKTVVFEDGTETLSLGCNYYTSSISISEGLFYDCPLTSLYLGRNINYKKYSNGNAYSSYPSYYGYSAFAKIQSTKNASDREDFSVEIGKYVTSIPKYLLYNCYSLKSVTISSKANITSIGEYAFAGNKALEDFEIPSSVKTIDDEAFSNCIELSSITIPAATTAIGDRVFDNCTGLKTLVFEDGTETISLGCNVYNTSISYSQGLFYDCPLTSLYLGRKLSYKNYPNSSYTYGSYPEYYGYSAFAQLHSGSNKEEVDVTIGKFVTSIQKYAFRNSKTLKSVTISSDANITSIGEYAFAGNNALEAFEIPSTVVTIGEYAFSGCILLTSISIPAATTSIGHFAFKQCSALKTLILEDGETSIELGLNSYSTSSNGGQGLFYDCPLTSIHIGRNITYETYLSNSGYTSFPDRYGYSAFAKLHSGTNKDEVNVEIGKYVTSIPMYLFYNSQTLKSVTISSEANITSIGKWAFNHAVILDAFTIPSTVTIIGDQAFYFCSALSSISIPGSVTKIGDKAFYSCSSLESVTFEDGDNEIKLGINNYDSSFGQGLFFNCALKTLYLGRNISYETALVSSPYLYGLHPEYYGYSAFARITKLSDVTVSSSVTSLRNDIFFGCSGIKKLTLAEASSDEESATLSLGNNNNDTGLFSAPTALEEFYLGRSLSFTGEPFRKTGGTSISAKVTIGENFTDIPRHTFYMLNLADDCQMTALGTKHWYRTSSATGYDDGTEITADLTVTENAKETFIGNNTVYVNSEYRYYRQPD